ncbi:MAG: site-2 protease family protein [bacterium]
MLLYWLIKKLLTNPLEFLVAFTLLMLPLLISITIHEWAHGMMAYKFGDPTPKEQGRLTLNPFAHLDPFGTLMLFIAGIGWAKPVEINPNNIPGKTKQMLVALAGPASNFILAVIFSFIVYGLFQYTHFIGINLEKSFIGLLIDLAKIIVKINILLGLFNMLPIPPLDGSNVLKWFLPEKLATVYSKIAPFGMFILLFILFTVGFTFISNAATKISIFIYKLIEYILSPIFGNLNF